MRFISFLILLVLILSSGEAKTQEVDIVKLVTVHEGRCAKPCNRVAVIFIHGITGSRETWINTRTNAFFPALVSKDASLRGNVDVYHLDYESFKFSGPDINMIGEAVATAIDPLMNRKMYRRVVLVGHSMGGLVAQAYLLHVKLQYGHQGLVRFPLFVTLSSPFHGSAHASFARLASANPQFRILVPINENDYQMLVNRSTDTAARKKAPRCGVKFQLDHFAAYETVGTKVNLINIGLVVTKDSATGNSEKPFPVAKDHLAIAKPKDSADEPYPWLRIILQNCVRRKGVCAPRSSICGPDFPGS